MLPLGRRREGRREIGKKRGKGGKRERKGEGEREREREGRGEEKCGSEREQSELGTVDT